MQKYQKFRLFQCNVESPFPEVMYIRYPYNCSVTKIYFKNKNHPILFRNVEEPMTVVQGNKVVTFILVKYASFW